MDLAKIGFLGMYRFEKGAAIRGAMLVTDIETKPLEFRVTSPVRPQKFQEIVYGELLEEHISVELIGLPLVNSLQQKPELILVRDVLLLGMNNKQETLTILMNKEDEDLIDKRVDTQSLNPINSTYPPIKIYILKKFQTDFKDIKEKLQMIFNSRNLMEPFDRLEKACEDIHTRKVGDK